jgi:hypothetical protein
MTEDAIGRKETNPVSVEGYNAGAKVVDAIVELLEKRQGVLPNNRRQFAEGYQTGIRDALTNILYRQESSTPTQERLSKADDLAEKIQKIISELIY